jgi:hypothetical protein
MPRLEEEKGVAAHFAGELYDCSFPLSLALL